MHEIFPSDLVIAQFCHILLVTITVVEDVKTSESGNSMVEFSVTSREAISKEGQEAKESTNDNGGPS